MNACDQFFWTPLHHAAHAGQVELIELLVEAGAATDAQALSGGTPLMRAIEASRPSCVDFLIKAGANVTAENKKGINVSQKFSHENNYVGITFSVHLYSNRITYGKINKLDFRF